MPEGVGRYSGDNAATPHPLHFGSFPHEENLSTRGQNDAVGDALLAGRDSDSVLVIIFEPPGKPVVVVLQRQANLATQLLFRSSLAAGGGGCGCRCYRWRAGCRPLPTAEWRVARQVEEYSRTRQAYQDDKRRARCCPLHLHLRVRESFRRRSR